MTDVTAAAVAAGVDFENILTTGTDPPALVHLQLTSEQMPCCLHAMVGRRQASFQNNNSQILATLTMLPFNPSAVIVTFRIEVSMLVVRQDLSEASLLDSLQVFQQSTPLLFPTSP